MSIRVLGERLGMTPHQAASPTARQEERVSQFMMLLYENPAAFENIPPDRMREVIGKYVAWREKLAAEGRLAASNKLRSDAGKILEPNGERVLLRDGPYGEAKELIGGYFLINARDYDEAARLAEGCPHLAFGGTIELREVEPT